MNLNNLLQWYGYNNINLFENCTVPAPIDINNVINNIILRCGLLTPVYTDPETFRQMTLMWFIANQYNFDHLVKILTADYSPIENVAEWDTQNTDKAGNSKDSYSGKDITTFGKNINESDTIVETHNLSTKESGNTTQTDTTATAHNVSAYNSGGYQADSQDVNSGSVTTGHGKTVSETGDIQTATEKGVKESGDNTFTYGHDLDNTHTDNEEFTRYRHGNIGVTTNTQLQSEELKWLEDFNPYDWIAGKFERDLFIQVY